MSMRSRYRHIRRKGKVKTQPQGYKKDANAVYRGILRDRAHRDLFITDANAAPMRKQNLQYGHDYLILRGGYAGRIARFVGTEAVKKYGSFQSVRGNEIRVNCSESGFAATPKLGCWMEPISSTERVYDRPAILLLQAKSVVGDIPKDEMHFSIREGNELIAQWTYKHKITPETVDIPKLEMTIVRHGNHERAHPALAHLVRRGFFVLYEDDGWLSKCDPTQRLRFMRRSHMYSITICRCGEDVVNAMMDDYTLRTLLPVRVFAGIPGIKQSQRPGHLRRSSSMMSSMEFDLADLLNDYDKTAVYSRIFNREGAVDGKCLCLDSPFLDATRSYIEHGGLARDCIAVSMVKWRKMIKMAASGDEPYLLMSEIRVANGQWCDVMNALPNSNFKRYSFSVIFYDGSNKQDSPKLAHKIMKPIKPKDDIAEVFRRRLFMNGGFICIALSRRNVSDESLPQLFDNVAEFVLRVADQYGYVARRCALGCHAGKSVYVDFQIFVKCPKRRKSVRMNTEMDSKENEYDDEEYDEDDDDDENDGNESDDDDDDDEEEEDDDDDDDEVDSSFYANTDSLRRSRK